METQSPLFVFKGRRLVSNLLDGAPPGSVAGISGNGWMNKELFVQRFKHFIANITEARTILLLIEGSSTHLSVEISKIGLKNDIDVNVFPPSTTNLLQPLDLTMFSTLKRKYKEACKDRNYSSYNNSIPRALVASTIRESLKSGNHNFKYYFWI